MYNELKDVSEFLYSLKIEAGQSYYPEAFKEFLLIYQDFSNLILIPKVLELLVILVHLEILYQGIFVQETYHLNLFPLKFSVSQFVVFNDSFHANFCLN